MEHQQSPQLQVQSQLFLLAAVVLQVHRKVQKLTPVRRAVGLKVAMVQPQVLDRYLQQAAVAVAAFLGVQQMQSMEQLVALVVVVHPAVTAVEQGQLQPRLQGGQV
jgi:hypothetical protein